MDHTLPPIINLNDLNYLISHVIMTQVNSFMNGHLQNSRSPTVFGGKVCLTIIIICPYSRCLEKGLIYIIIIAPSSRQPSFYSKCIKSNICSYYNIYLISNGKYTCTITLNSL